MHINDIVLIHTGILTILYYKLNYTYYIKKRIGISTFKKIKPFDCFSCSSFWYSIYSLFIFTPLDALYFITLCTLSAVIIETCIEK